MSTGFGVPCGKCGVAAFFRFETFDGRLVETLIKGCEHERKRLRICRDCPASIADQWIKRTLCGACRAKAFAEVRRRASKRWWDRNKETQNAKKVGKAREHYGKNQEEILARRRARYARDREKVREKDQQRALRLTPEQRAKNTERGRAYRERMKEQLKARRRAYYEKNRERLIAASREHRQFTRVRKAAQERLQARAKAQAATASPEMGSSTKAAA